MIDTDPLRKYDTGATRGGSEVRLTLLPMDSILRCGKIMELGAKRHGDHNWRNGIPVEDCLDHALTHIAKYLLGDDAEEHLAHAACNLLMAIHFDEKSQPEREQPHGTRC